jgi:hypothetical protein
MSFVEKAVPSRGIAAVVMTQVDLLGGRCTVVVARQRQHASQHCCRLSAGDLLLHLQEGRVKGLPDLNRTSVWIRRRHDVGRGRIVQHEQLVGIEVAEKSIAASKGLHQAQLPSVKVAFMLIVTNDSRNLTHCAVALETL